MLWLLERSAGPEIAVTFWHELRKGTDIWYSPTTREARSRLRLVPIAECAILTADLLRTSSTQRHKFIPWTDMTPRHMELPGRDGTTLTGYIRIHLDHITPTRCEVHSLLAGLHHSGDTAFQICNNTTAIGLVVLARSLKRRGGQPRYSNIHRVELRSLMALFNPVGAFAGDWIRAHQDSTSTIDPVLRAKQGLLAEADSLVTLAYQLLPPTNYAHLTIPGSWELRDHHDLPVTGATAPWLGAIYSRHDWHAAQASKPDARRTIQPLRLNTGELCKWNLPALSFYFRAICYTLHTNVRKHRIQPLWDPHCRTCPDSLDTQEDRFGLTHPQCPTATSLTQDLLLAHKLSYPKHGSQTKISTYLPGHCTASANYLRNPTSIHHVSTPQWYKLTTSNPVPIHIGFLPNGSTPCLLTPAQNHWTEALRPLDATHWLHHPPPTLFSTTPADASTTNPKILTAPTHCLH
ncbi:hypothetical protein DYB28_000289 [Aphanomyces astaci]|uniref:Uncharacterized protein n=1 Tax=Aphanomyces astaci TaxID=112090 RepID=A0A9X8DZH8_APHAT|nr:hypothetical protein DYB28_000289 [Aphanomyces astaci]